MLFISLFFISALLLFGIILPNETLNRSFFVHGTYYVMTLLIFVWAATFIRYLSSRGIKVKTYLWGHRPGIWLGFVLSILVFISQQPNFRYMYDEANLVSVSQQILKEKKAERLNEGEWYQEAYHTLGTTIPRRPVLFPYLIYIVHLIIGYRPENVFVLQFLLLVIFLSGLWIFFKRFMDSFWASASVFLVVTQPILSQVASSGHYDFLSTMIIMVFLINLRLYLKEKNLVTFNFLIVNLMVLANIRSEAFIYPIITITLLLLLKQLPWGHLKNSPVFVLMPVFMYPVVSQRFLRGDYPILPPSLLEEFLKNLKAFGVHFIDFSWINPHAGLTNLFGVIVIAALLYRIITRRLFLPKHDLLTLLIGGLALAAHFGAFVTSYYGSIDHPWTTRYYLPYTLLFTIFAAYGLQRLLDKRLQKHLVVFLVFTFFLLYYPIHVVNEFAVSRPGNTRIFHILHHYFKGKHKQNRNILIISRIPAQFSMYNMGAVSIDYANKNFRTLRRKMRMNFYSKMFVVQETSYKWNRPKRSHELTENFQLKTLYKERISGDSYVWISQVDKIT